MPIEVVQLPSEDPAKILALQEGHFTEIKSTRVSPKSLTKAMAALANADGGELFVGLEDDPRGFTWAGFNNAEAANGHLQLFEELFPLGDGFQYEFFAAQGMPGLLLHVLIEKSGSAKRA